MNLPGHFTPGPEFGETLRAGARRAHETGQVDPASLEALRRSGLLGMMVHEDHGGWGYDAAAANTVIEAVAADNPSIAIMLYLHCAVVVRIEQYGTEAQKKHWLPRVARGGELVASAWSEPGSTADKRSLSTSAQRDTAGGWEIKGGKTFSTSATVADFFIVLVQLPSTTETAHSTGPTYGGSDQALFLVEAATSGVQVPPDALDMAGMRGSGTGMVRFQDVTVAEGNLLCSGSATTEAIQLPHRLGLTLGAVSVGLAQAAHETALGHARDRELFDEPRFQRQLASTEIAVRSARAAVRDLTAGPAHDRVLRAYCVKVFASTTGETVCGTVRGLLGSAGYLQAHEINRISHDAEAVTHMGPPTHLCLDLIAGRLDSAPGPDR
ncbi:acyl-CoA dehydrogenase family protein [Amycolatopsis sp. cmx-11-12]|uniref:acyl-CoA dehydrogenase family protein n=1 Tax=Amycolatopsis sp. cmx-11-12 TaxID=2785795 RepID=UPI0039183D75